MGFWWYRYEVLALQQCNKATAHPGVHGGKQNTYSLQAALVACMVSIYIELRRENFLAAHTHLQNGLKLPDEIQRPLKPSVAENSRAKQLNPCLQQYRNIKISSHAHGILPPDPAMSS